ncbi:MAG: putative metallopeptidase [Bacillota bacterium]
MSIWELEQNHNIYSTLRDLIRTNHSHLVEANISIYFCDKNKLKSNQAVIADTSKSSSKLKASTNADFTITIYMNAWDSLNPEQKIACLDHELCHCSVHYEPVKEAVGGGRGGRQRFKIVKDELGRTQYTNEIKRNEEGEPKWKLETHDLEEFRSIVDRHGIWDENIRSFKEALDHVRS